MPTGHHSQGNGKFPREWEVASWEMTAEQQLQLCICGRLVNSWVQLCFGATDYVIMNRVMGEWFRFYLQGFIEQKVYRVTHQIGPGEVWFYLMCHPVDSEKISQIFIPVLRVPGLLKWRIYQEVWGFFEEISLSSYGEPASPSTPTCDAV